MTENEPAIFEGGERLPASLPRPGEVIPRPYDELAVEKVAPAERKEILDAIKPKAFVDLPDPFDGVELPADDEVNHPKHYHSHPSGVVAIDIVRFMTFDCGNAFKYVFRFDHKNGRQDLDKACWYLRDAIEHADPVFLPGGYHRAHRALHLVTDSETNPHRREFFRQMSFGAKNRALAAIQNLLNTL